MPGRRLALPSLLFVMAIGLVLLVSSGGAATGDPPNPDGDNGWYVSSIFIDFQGPTGYTCVPEDETYSGPDGVSIERSATCDDGSGPTVIDMFGPFNFDSTAPVGVSGTPDRAPDFGGNGGWFNSPVAIEFSGSDAVSGMASCMSSAYSGPDGAGVTVDGTCTNNAGLTSAPTASSAFNYDAVPPDLTVPTDITVEATSPSGAPVTWATTATDPGFGSIPPSQIVCTHLNGTTFPIGTTTVNCQANDGHGLSTSGSFSVRVVDTTPPLITTPGDLTVEATGPTMPVTYVASASDAVGVTSFACAPASGTEFALGVTTVNCNASDAAGNTSTASFTITVADTTPPNLTVPTDIETEAVGPNGAPVSWPEPTATDPGFGPLLPSQISCSAQNGAVFPLGVTTVTCIADDGRGNTSSGSFAITVVDTTPPTLPAYPSKVVVYEDTDSAIRKSSLGALFNPKATDIVDGAVPTEVVPDLAQYPLGQTVLTFTATDAAGNTSAPARVVLEVRKVPVGVKPGTVVTKIDLTAPAKPKNFKARPGDHKARLSWNHVSTPDFKQYVVTRTTGRTLAAASATRVVYRGTENRYVDRKLRNGVEYMYEIVAVDRAGNHSAVATASVTPRAILLVKPKDGAKIRIPARSKKLKFRWAPLRRASYYNMQLYRVVGRGANSELVKIGSFWPSRAQLTLKRTWRFEGEVYRLRPGWRMVWYVWPGYGPRTDAEFGKLMGKSNFKVLKAKTAS